MKLNRSLFLILGLLLIIFIINFFIGHPVELSKYESIRNGDTLERVIGLLGEPSSKRYEGDELLTIYYRGIFPLWCSIEITFENKLVCSKFHDH